jgi:hypothetical protein
MPQQKPATLKMGKTREAPQGYMADLKSHPFIWEAGFLNRTHQ